MKYILPLVKEREKYHFEISNDGKELTKNNIIPIVNSENRLQNGIVYVESPFQNEEYLEITNFNKLSQDKWKEILQELSSKIGAKRIKTTLVLERENSKSMEAKDESGAEISGNYKVAESKASIKKTQVSKENITEQLKSSLEFELNLKGKKQSLEEVEKWLKDKKIDLENNLIFRILFEQFKNDNLGDYKETKKIEQIITGLNDVNNTLLAIANIKSPLFSLNMNTALNSTNKEEFSQYEKTELILEITF